MTIPELNELANDILVARLEIADAKAEMENIIAKDPKLMELQTLIDSSAMVKESKQYSLLKYMRERKIKQWKTETGTFSRAKRVTARVMLGYDKQVKAALEAGEVLEGWELVEKEYMSIRSNKQ